MLFQHVDACSVPNPDPRLPSASSAFRTSSIAEAVPLRSGSLTRKERGGEVEVEQVDSPVIKGAISLLVGLSPQVEDPERRMPETSGLKNSYIEVS
jgi:hypothetical protein